MKNDETTERWLDELTEAECLSYLRANEVGRIAIIHEGRPFVFPINYRLIESLDARALVIQTCPGNVIDLGDDAVAFEIDGIDPSHERGWSVLVQGSLCHIEDSTLLEEHLRSTSWIAESRTSWLAIEPAQITGRRLLAASLQWAFRQSAYL